MITYNHEAFIQEAIESILSQDTTFTFELFIANDCSNDNTHNIIENLIKAHPQGHLINYVNHPINKGMNENFKFALNACQGSYIAICEGDDYWIDNNKLQRQVDFLEKNGDYSYCGSNSYILGSDVLTKSNYLAGDILFETLVKKNVLNTATLMFRTELLQFQNLFSGNIVAGDWILQLYALKFGKGYCLPDFTAVYRLHDSGIWSSLKNKEKGKLGIRLLQQAKILYKGNQQRLNLIDNAIEERKKEFSLVKTSYIKRIKGKLGL